MMLINKVDRYIKLKLDEINNLIEQELINVANEEYKMLIDFCSNSIDPIDNTLKSEIHVSYAFFLFSCGEYEGFLDELSNAQKYGYFVGELENILFEGFIEPNLQQFESNYIYSVKNLQENCYLNLEIIAFNDLPYWIIPTGQQDRFYLYNKQSKQLENKFSYKDEMFGNLSLEINEVFSDNVFDIDGNLAEVFELINTNVKKNYAIVKEFGLLLSSLQGKKFEISFFEKLTIFDSHESFKQYFINSNVFLPRNIIYDNSLGIIWGIINSVHLERVNKGIFRDNILLSICIPSYNRGQRALENVKKLLKSRYDNEIEVIVSNNGSVNDTKSYYREINEIQDSRLIYYEFEENQGFALNTCKVCELANGQYILLISDEDFVDFEVLDKVMHDLRSSDGKISIYRTSTTSQSKVQSGEYIGGIHAFRAYMLTSNYMSGIILNNNLMKKLDAIEYVRNKLGNKVCEAYPHMYWELLLLQYGVVKGTNQILILEGTAEGMENEMVVENREVKVPYYATLESRLNQHKGFYEIFGDLEVPKNDEMIFRELYLSLCMKTLFLVKLSINVFYKKDASINIKEILEEAYEFCMNSDFLVGNRQQRKRDVESIYNYYNGLIKDM